MLSFLPHVSRHDGPLHEIIEGRMKGKPTEGRRIQMVYDSANDRLMVALLHSDVEQRTREGWRH